MQNELPIPQPWRDHVAQQLAEARRMKRDAAMIEGEAMRIGRTIAADLKVTLPQIYNISGDGSKITWETPDPPAAEPKE